MKEFRASTRHLVGKGQGSLILMPAIPTAPTTPKDPALVP
jgi:hypothetical protein